MGPPRRTIHLSERLPAVKGEIAPPDGATPVISRFAQYFGQSEAMQGTAPSKNQQIAIVFRMTGLTFLRIVRRDYRCSIPFTR